MAIGIQVTMDAADPGKLAAFWAEALGYVVQPPPPGFDSWEDFALKNDIPFETINDYSAIVDPEGAGPRFFFQRVPEGKTAKNRLHLDVNAGLEAVDRLVALGATKVQEFEDNKGHWVVMLDPEGNEFCVQ
ncbi:VOC family protein [Lentzea sp. DG1S-22]|uniref:VOC family protein n=1 Tax=Lentzea sp. DG1S-22 TaxID=3108822 RepID=UPI002E7A17BB|nr:VOC family protein [Lentzea sp. DG1S-22]WVH80634.1 VOC family protein [Lentzea sp. DG1S-22]